MTRSNKMLNLYDCLREYADSDAYPFHMPGHKRRLGAVAEARAIDITEIDGFDNLHHAEGVLKEAQERAGKLYGCETYYLVNGSTCGILAAVSATVPRGGKILMARNCHKAAYHAAELMELETVYLYPRKTEAPGSIGGDIRPEDVREMLDDEFGNSLRTSEHDVVDCSEMIEHEYEKLWAESEHGHNANGTTEHIHEKLTSGSEHDNAAETDAGNEISAVLITSPTYEGVVSDIKGIAEITHEYGIPLIVDAAHGAHFGFHSYFPKNAIEEGADLVIHSLHKTLPSLTQTALIHRNSDMLSKEKLQKYLGIYQTSSPSYVLMAGMDECVRLLEEQGEELFDAFAVRLQNFREKMKTLSHVSLLEPEDGVFAKDPSKLVLQAEGYHGNELAELLRRDYQLEMEMAAGSYVVALTSIADTDEGFERLFAALKELDERIAGKTDGSGSEDRHACTVETTVKEVELPEMKTVVIGAELLQPDQCMRLSQAASAPARKVPLKESAGKVSADYVYLYPPGIPLLAPGERIGSEILKQLISYQKAGYELEGMSDLSGKEIRVIV